ncbi:hypothetical protein [Methylobacter tundripaludum]|uniref:hypothetical protein n=1 Tax=Methylobacter tundripaludum TaxID=173365 RepID=UPI0005601641|nr:hypothetical protein [Methylobacter tundripaludum]
MTETSQDDKKRPNRTENGSKISLSTPWGGTQSSERNARTRGKRNVLYTPISEESSPDIHNNFVKERTRLHEIYIREESRNKRIGLVLAFLLILFASLIVLFAPAGRETISYWIGAALIIFAAGTAGFGRVWGKAASISFGADQDDRDLGM